jgi:hypothetical protein
MNGLKGVLSIIKEMNKKFITKEEIDSGKFIINFTGFSDY